MFLGCWSVVFHVQHTGLTSIWGKLLFTSESAESYKYFPHKENFYT